MAQDINPLSPLSTVEAYVRSFITTDTDGSQSVNQPAMITWLAEQFGYLTASGATPTTKSAQAADIASNLQGTVGRSHWQSYPDYPNQTVSNSEAIKLQLNDLRRQMGDQVKAIEDGYRDFDATLATRVKAVFNTVVGPSFPAGVQLLEATRAYVETFVTDWGEESKPSPVSTLVTLDQNDTATITGSAPPSDRHITHRRLYRSATGQTQSAFKLQGEYLVSQTTIVDSKIDKELNDVCKTFGWLEPPADLQGLTGMPNGIMLGFVDRTLYACEPYAPYAYPSKYTKPLLHRIVGIVTVGQSAFVGTTGRPYLVSGSDSASLSEELISSNVPCMSARSMVAIGNSVFYAGPDGLALYESGSVKNVTEGAIDLEAWQAYNPSSMRAGEFDGMYIAFYTKADTTKGALVFDYKSRTLAELDQAADAVFADESGIYVLNGTAILDMLPAGGANRSGSWHSKTQQLARPQAFAWLQVHFSPGNVGAVSAVVRTYANGVLHHTATITSSDPVRHPPGRCANWRVEIDSAARIDGVVLASTTEELKAIT